MQNLVSFSGIFVLMALAWAFSTDRRRINGRVIVWGTAIQLLLAVFVFAAPPGRDFFLLLNKAVVQILDAASAGSRFVFGRLALPPGETGPGGETSLGFFLAFQGFPPIIFFSALIALLYYFNVLPWLIRGFAYVFTKLMRVSGAESLAAAGNIFVGVESALTVKPYLREMTRSELCTILTVGMATVASNVMALYVFTLRPVFSNIAGHLISASLLSAPAALVMAKILHPESGRPLTLGVQAQPYYERERNVFEAIINGANAGVKMILGIVALLIAVLGLIGLADAVLGRLGVWTGTLTGIEAHWSLAGLLGVLCYPFALLLGVPPVDALHVARMLGERLIATEVVAYQDLASTVEAGLFLEPRSAVVASYALCGFAHLASMAIFVGGVAALAPERTRDLTEVAVRALAAATLACLMTACVAGTFLTGSSILLG